MLLSQKSRCLECECGRGVAIACLPVSHHFREMSLVWQTQRIWSVLMDVSGLLIASWGDTPTVWTKETWSWACGLPRFDNCNHSTLSQRSRDIKEIVPNLVIYTFSPVSPPTGIMDYNLAPNKESVFSLLYNGHGDGCTFIFSLLKWSVENHHWI